MMEEVIVEFTPTDIHEEYLFPRVRCISYPNRITRGTHHKNDREHNRVHLDRSDFRPALAHVVNTGSAAEHFNRVTTHPPDEPLHEGRNHSDQQPQWNDEIGTTRSIQLLR